MRPLSLQQSAQFLLHHGAGEDRHPFPVLLQPGRSRFTGSAHQQLRRVGGAVQPELDTELGKPLPGFVGGGRHALTFLCILRLLLGVGLVVVLQASRQALAPVLGEVQDRAGQIAGAQGFGQAMRSQADAGGVASPCPVLLDAVGEVGVGIFRVEAGVEVEQAHEF